MQLNSITHSPYLMLYPVEAEELCIILLMPQPLVVTALFPDIPDILRCLPADMRQLPLVTTTNMLECRYSLLGLYYLISQTKKPTKQKYIHTHTHTHTHTQRERERGEVYVGGYMGGYMRESVCVCVSVCKKKEQKM